jgi:hypothetical protein
MVRFQGVQARCKCAKTLFKIRRVNEPLKLNYQFWAQFFKLFTAVT